MKKRRTATLVIDTQKHLQEFTGPYLSYYDATILAGQCARMMGRIRGMEIVGNLQALSAMATSIGILPSHLKMMILPTLENSGMINIRKDGAGKIRKIEEHVPGEKDILNATYEIWERFGANEVEKASILNLDQCSIMPHTEKELNESRQQEGLKREDVAFALELQTDFELLKKSSSEPSPLIYSPYVWGENAPSILGFISHLKGNEKNAVNQLLEKVSHNQALPFEQVTNIPENLLSASRKTGLIDVCQVSTRAGAGKGFVFTPRMWGALGGDTILPDIYDEVKLFLSSISFGKHYSGISRIKYPVALVEALIQRGEVGPATAIGSDFLLLEKHGIVRVAKDQTSVGRYNMYLVKEDVAKTALEVMKHKRVLGIAEKPSFNVDGLFQTGDFINPEQDKIRLGKLTSSSARAEERFIRILRDEELT